MPVMKPADRSAADAPSSRSRREALMRFARYSALAPAAMVLLEPEESLAKKGKGKGKGWSWGRGGRSHY
jgi:hypothetical protein